MILIFHGHKLARMKALLVTLGLILKKLNVNHINLNSESQHLVHLAHPAF